MFSIKALEIIFCIKRYVFSGYYVSKKGYFASLKGKLCIKILLLACSIQGKKTLPLEFRFLEHFYAVHTTAFKSIIQMVPSYRMDIIQKKEHIGYIKMLLTRAGQIAGC